MRRRFFCYSNGRCPSVRSYIKKRGRALRVHPSLFVLGNVFEALLCLSGSFAFFGSGFAFGSSGSGFGLSLSGSSGSFLFSHFLCYFGIDFLFGCQTGLDSSTLFSVLLTGKSSSLVGLILLPSFKLSLCGCLVESAFLHAAAQVLHQEHTLAREDITHRVGGLCAGFEPIEGAVKIQIHSGRIGVGDGRGVAI